MVSWPGLIPSQLHWWRQNILNLILTLLQVTITLGQAAYKLGCSQPLLPKATPLFLKNIDKYLSEYTEFGFLFLDSTNKWDHMVFVFRL